MNISDRNKMFVVCSKFKNIRINVNQFCNLMSDSNMYSDPYLTIITDRSILTEGHYGVICECNIWISENVLDGYMHVSNQLVLNSKDKGVWSPPIVWNDINMADRIVNMKAFW